MVDERVDAFKKYTRLLLLLLLRDGGDRRTVVSRFWRWSL
jgi:hypothetical protein